MPSKGRSRKAVAWIENIRAVLPRGLPIVDDQRQDNVAGGRLPVGYVFGPAAADHSVASDSLAGVAAVFSFMAKSSVSLIRAMVGCGPGDPSRKCEGRERFGALQKADRFVECARAFLGSDSSAAGKNHDVAVHSAAQFLHESRIERRILAREIHFSNYGAGGIACGFCFIRSKNREGNKNEQGRQTE